MASIVKKLKYEKKVKPVDIIEARQGTPGKRKQGVQTQVQNKPTSKEEAIRAVGEETIRRNKEYRQYRGRTNPVDTIRDRNYDLNSRYGSHVQAYLDMMEEQSRTPAEEAANLALRIQSGMTPSGQKKTNTNSEETAKAAHNLLVNMHRGAFGAVDEETVRRDARKMFVESPNMEAVIEQLRETPVDERPSLDDVILNRDRAKRTREIQHEEWYNAGEYALSTLTPEERKMVMTVPVYTDKNGNQRVGRGKNRYLSAEAWSFLQERFGQNADHVRNYINFVHDAEVGSKFSDAIEKSVEQSPVAASVATAVSVPLNLTAGALGAVDLALQTARSATGTPVNWNSPMQQFAAAASNIRDSVTEDIKYGVNGDKKSLFRDVMAFGYGVGTSMADSWASMIAGKYGTLILGATAATQAAQAAKTNGASDKEALLKGLTAGAAETAMEFIGMDRLFDVITGDIPIRTFREIVENVGKQALAEGGEELGTTIINTIMDVVIRGDENELSARVDELHRGGMKIEDAKWKVAKEWFGQALVDALSGVFSGGVSGGIAGGISVLADPDSFVQKKASTTADKPVANTPVSAPSATEPTQGEAQQNKAASMADSAVIKRSKSQSVGGFATTTAGEGGLVQRTFINGLEDGENGVLMAKSHSVDANDNPDLKQGTSVPASSLTFEDENTQQLLTRAQEMGLNAQQAEAYIGGYDADSGVTLEQYNDAFDTVARVAGTDESMSLEQVQGVIDRVNASMGTNSESAVRTDVLTQDAFRAAYDSVRENVAIEDAKGLRYNKATRSKTTKEKQFQDMWESVRSIDRQIHDDEIFDRVSATVGAVISRRVNEAKSGSNNPKYVKAFWDGYNYYVYFSPDGHIRKISRRKDRDIKHEKEKNIGTDAMEPSERKPGMGGRHVGVGDGTSRRGGAEDVSDGGRGDILRGSNRGNTLDGDGKGGRNGDSSRNRAGDVHKGEPPAGTVNKTGKAKSASEVVDSIRARFNIPINVGHYAQKRTAKGIYKIVPEAVRIRVANDFETIAHELGHHLDKQYHLESLLTDGLQKELLAGADEGFLRLYEPEDRIGESIAEFFKAYMTNEEYAAETYPEFIPWIMNVMDKRDADSIVKLSADIRAILNNGDDAQSYISDPRPGGILGVFSDIKTAIGNKTIAQEFSNLWDKAAYLFLTGNQGFRKMDAAFGTHLENRADNLAYVSEKAGAVFNGDLMSRDGNKVLFKGGFKAVFEGCNMKNPTVYKDFNEYLVVLHGQERLAAGMRVFGQDEKNDANWMRKRQDVLEKLHPEFIEVEKRLQQFWDAFSKEHLVNSGLLTKDSYNKMRKKWKHYVPLNRVMSDLEASAQGSGKAIANKNNPVRAAKGSGRNIISPIASMMQKIPLYMTLGEQNTMMQDVAYVADAMNGAGIFMERIPELQRPVEFNTAKQKLEFERRLEGLGLNEDATDVIMAELDETVTDMLRQFVLVSPHHNYITVRMDGKPVYYQVNDMMLLKSIMQMDRKQENILVRTLSVVNHFMTGNLTGMNLLFSLPNILRDLQTAGNYTKTKATWAFVKGYVSAVKNQIFHALPKTKSDAYYNEYIAMGGGKFSAYSTNTDTAQRAISEMFGRNWKSPVEYVKVVFDTIEFLANFAETNPRYATYELYRKQGYSPEEAFHAATDITVNFRRSGVAGAQFNKAIPFFNAGIQGMDKFRRWITAEDAPSGSRKQAAISRTAQWVGGSLIVATIQVALNSVGGDDEEKEKAYAQLSNYTKNNNICVYIGNGKFLTIPKARELSVMSTLFERAIDRVILQNKGSFDDFGEYAADNLLPPALSSLAQGDLHGFFSDLGVIGALVQVSVNKDYLGRDIEPSYLASLPSRERFKSETSKLAYALGQITGWSPLKIDHFCSNMLGGFWKAQKALLPMEGNADWSLTLGSRFVKDSLYSTDIVNMAYDLQEELNARANGKQATPADLIHAQMAGKSVGFYGKYNSLAKSEAEATAARFTRQVVIDMLNGTNGYLKGWGGSEGMKWVEEVITESGEMDAKTFPVPDYMSETVKDYAGNDRKLTASQYVTYQEIYNTEYWRYVDIIRNSSETENLYNALVAAKESAKKYADATMLAILDGRQPKENNRTDSDILENLLADAENISSSNSYNAQRTVLFSAISSGDTSSARKQVQEMKENGATDEDVRDSINGKFSGQYKAAWAEGDKETCKNIETVLKALGFRYKSTGKPYFTDDKFRKWRSEAESN